MTKEDITEFEEVFKRLLLYYDNKTAYNVIVPLTDDWEFPLPKIGNQGSATFMIEISNWTREGSRCTEDGLYIKTAFGEKENSKLFSFREVVAIIDAKGQVVIAKPYPLPDPKELKVDNDRPEGGYTLKGLIEVPEEDNPGLKRSMDAFKKNNPPKEK